MTEQQLSMFDLLFTEQDAAEPSAARPCVFSCAHEAGLRSYDCFGTCRETIDLNAFTPGPAFYLEHFPYIAYYIAHDLLPHEDEVYMFVSFEDKDYSQERQKYEKRYAVPVSALLDEANYLTKGNNP